MITIEPVIHYFKALQDRICADLEQADDVQGSTSVAGAGSAGATGKAKFIEDSWEREGGGGGRTRILANKGSANGAVFEKGGVNFSHVFGDKLPPSASAVRPELAGRSFQAAGVSLVMHPNNPYVPTSHANVRVFIAEKKGEAPVWWFGGGYDLTPYYAFDEDCLHWHQTAKSACDPFGAEIYPRFKKWCDEYFYLKHRNETRGVGGLFFDDFHELGADQSFALLKSIGDSYTKAYLPIVQKRREMKFGAREKEFQLYRRGRYVEFNLVYDRGTLFGLQSGGRTESILMSLPPEVKWGYDWKPEAGSAEEKLYTDYLKPREWL